MFGCYYVFTVILKRIMYTCARGIIVFLMQQIPLLCVFEDKGM